MAVRTVWTGDAPAQVPHYYGTFSEIVAITGPNGAIGHPTDSKELLEYEDGEWGSIGATSKFPPAPGSPSAPFTTVDERTAWATANLATLLPGRTTAWGPGNAEYVWNGPLATDWQGIRGPYLGSAENPFPDTTARNAAVPFVPGSTVYTSGAPTLVPWTLSVGATGETDADWVTTGVIVADDDAAEALMSVAGYGSSCQTVAGALWTSGAP